MNEEIVQRVIRVISKIERIPVEKINIDSTFEELGIDSLDAFSILFEIENEFQITIPDDATRSIRNVRAVCEGIASLLQPQPTTPAAAV